MAIGLGGSRAAVADVIEDRPGSGAPGAAAPGAKRCPHSLQNLLAGVFEVPQEGQMSPKRVPHSAQNLATSGLAWPHCGQRTALVQGTAWRAEERGGVVSPRESMPSLCM